MKKLMMVLLLLPMMVAAEVQFDYEESEDGAIALTDVRGKIPDNLVIPSTYEGKTVRRIGKDFLEGCATILGVTFPDSVVEIGEDAFRYCVKLSSVEWPSRLRVIGEAAFRGCVLLEADLSGTELVKVGENAFSECVFLKVVRFPKTLTTLTGHCFSYCSELSSVYYSGGIPQVELYDDNYDEWSDKIYVYRKNGLPAYLEHVVSYVLPDMGWESIVARGEWQGRPIRYVETSPQIGSFEVVPGETVSFDTGLIGYTAKGLPSGLKYDKKTGEITGAAKKPTAAEGVTVKFTKKGEADVTMTVVVGPIPTINVTLEGDTEKCKVTGGNKAYLVGKKVSLQAKGPKGTAFVGWFKDGEPWPSAEESKNTKLSYVMTKESISLVACFEKEKMSIDASAIESAAFQVGAEVAEGVIVINVETQSGLKTLKATKLPSGLKLKRDKKTGIWSVCGKPKKAGAYEIKLTATAKSGAVETLVVSVTVGEKDTSGEAGPLGKLPEWVVGSFEGMMAEEDDLGWRCVMSISGTGDVTVKVISADNSKVGTASAKCKLLYKTYDGGYYFEYNDAYCHKKYTIMPKEIDGVILGVLEGEGNYLSADREEYDKSFGVQNVWSRAAGTALCPLIAKGTQVELNMSDWTERGWRYQYSNYDLDGCFLMLTYGQNGNMSVAFFENGETKASATASTVLVPYELSEDGKTLKALASVVFAPRGRHPIGLALYFNIDVAQGVVYGSDFTLDHYYMENR